MILASASPRRRGLLQEAGYRFEVIPSNADEEQLIEETVSPRQVAEKLAYHKAKDVADRLSNSAVVLGADTIVVCENQILGKARDSDHARQMLYMLSRTHHCVITGVALVETGTSRQLTDSEISWVTMRPMSEQEIDDYIASGSWQDKAGSYAVQEGADKFIVRIDGSYTNVVGLPMDLVGRMLKPFRIESERRTET
ncbi:MAG: Maf family protein [Phycisphaerae bacterium]